MNESSASRVKPTMAMKSKLLLGIVLVALTTPAFARLVRMWSNDELMKASDLVVTARPISTTNLNEVNGLGWSVNFRGVETTFKVIDVFKGMPKNDRIVLHHYRDDPHGQSLTFIDGPDLIVFPSGTTNLYLLYLTNDGPDRYAPVTGQIDPWQSVQSPTNLTPGMRFGFPEIPAIADADPSVCHTLTMQIPRQLIFRPNNAMSIGIGFDTNSMVTTNFMVGTNMIVGTETETEIYPADHPESKKPTGSGLESGTQFSTANIWINGPFKELTPGIKYMVETHFILFETDIPPQHMWEPQSPKYKVLWEQTLEQTIQSP
ncbi:MAG TPA: hypothetical protein VGN23_03210 [Verrucomicrobiae bacterium]|jgi:hypothetical protein